MLPDTNADGDMDEMIDGLDREIKRTWRLCALGKLDIEEANRRVLMLTAERELLARTGAYRGLKFG